MWSLEWPEEVSSAAHSHVNLPGSPGGLFNNIVRKHEPPDPTELDPELLRTLDLPSRTTSTDSLDSGSDAAMMDNWQMNEVFQDISSMLDHGTGELAADQDGAVEQMVNEIFSKETDTLITPTLTESNSHLDLDDIIKDTIGDAAMSLLDDDVFEQHLSYPSLNDSLSATALTDSALIDFDLLNELEAMGNTEESPSAVVPEVVAHSPTSSLSEQSIRSSVSEDSVCVVASDHQYTQLSNVTAKPHETKKQAIRRVKNNAASRVCRRQRKNRLTTNVGKMAELTAKNNDLLEQIREVESMVTLLKDHLVKATSRK